MGSAKSHDLPKQTSVFNLEDTQIIEEAKNNAAFMTKSLNNIAFNIFLLAVYEKRNNLVKQLYKCAQTQGNSKEVVSHTDLYRNNALHIAAIMHNTDIFFFLFEIGVSESANDEGRFPIDIAIKNDYKDIVSLFCNRKPNYSVSTRNDDNRVSAVNSDSPENCAILIDEGHAGNVYKHKL